MKISIEFELGLQGWPWPYRFCYVGDLRGGAKVQLGGIRAGFAIILIGQWTEKSKLNL